jgi:hypothetical protein
LLAKQSTRCYNLIVIWFFKSEKMGIRQKMKDNYMSCFFLSSLNLICKVFTGAIIANQAIKVASIGHIESLSLIKH